MHRIEKADRNADSELSRISFAAKSHWKYPTEYMDIWKNELTITKEYIDQHIVRCLSIDGKIVGFYSIVFLEKEMEFGKIKMERGFWLDHMFILPEYHKRGIGRLFFEDINSIVVKLGIEDQILAFVDPNAAGFYEKMGCELVRISESSIPNRSIPVYKYRIG